MGEMAIMDGSGDTKIMWSKANGDEVANAQRTFDDLVRKGHQAFTVKPDGEAGERVTTFNADLEKIILIPRMVGG